MIESTRLHKLTSLMVVASLVLLGLILAMIGILVVSTVASKGWLALPAAVFFAGVVVMFVFTVRDTVGSNSVWRER